MTRRPRVESLEDRRLLAAYVVNTNADTVAVDGMISLREAIQAANINAAFNEAVAGASEGDSISFNLPAGMETITLGSALPMITDDIVINGDNTAGSGTNVTIDGAHNNRIFLIAIGAGSIGADAVEDVTLQNLTLQNATAPSNFLGGAIANSTDGQVGVFDHTLVIRDVSFDNNTAISGGAISTATSNSTASVVGLDIDGATFTNNLAAGSGVPIPEAGSGGAINVGQNILSGRATSARITNATFTGNVADGVLNAQGGGAIRISEGSTLTIDDSGGDVIIGGDTVGEANTAQNGGGIFSAGTLIIDDSGPNSVIIGGNNAARAGGGIEIFSGSADISGSFNIGSVAGTTSGNTADVNGGGLHVSGTGTTNITGGTFQGNTAAEEGGGLWNSGAGVMNINVGTVVSGNSAGLSGGGIYNAGGTLVLTGSTIGGATAADGNTASGDSATQGGGGIFSENGDVTIQNDVGVETVIQNNVADGNAGSGGGVFILDGMLTMNDSRIVGNTANRAGGGVEIVDGAANFNGNSRLLSNDVLGIGGVAGTAGNGGGLHISGTIGTIVRFDNAIVAHNMAANEGGGLWNQVGSTLVIDATQVVNNTANGTGGGGVFNNGGIVNFDADPGPATLVDNKANGNNGDGGGLLSNGGTVNVTSIPGQAISVRTNTATRNGGGIAAIGGATLNVDGIDILNNTAGEEGGGLWISDDSTLTFNDTNVAVVVDGNIASGDNADQGGGGIFVEANGTLDIISAAAGQGITFSNNFADGNAGSGGGILVDSGGMLTIDGSDGGGVTISGNTANRAGGGIETTGGTIVTLTNVLLGGPTVVDGNTALGIGGDAATNGGGNGGGLHITGAADVTIDGGNVSGNIAKAEGGGLWNSASGTLRVTSASGFVGISNNEARGNAGGTPDAFQGGGGIFNDGGTLDINGFDNGVSIDNNLASGPSAGAGTTAGSGGGIMSIGGDVTIDTVGIQFNEAVRAGGGIEIIDGTVQISNSFIFFNDVSDGGLIPASSPGNGGGLHVTRNAIVDLEDSFVDFNTAQAEGGGLWNSAGGTMTIDGGTVNGNTAFGPGADQAGGGIFNAGGEVNLINMSLTFNIANTPDGSGGGGFSDGGTFNVSGSTVSGNDLYGIVFFNGATGDISTGNTFSGNVGGAIGPIGGTVGDDTIVVTANSITINGNTLTLDPSLTDPIVIDGGDGDDIFIIDVSSGPILVPITFNGGANVSSMPGDEIQVVGPDGIDLTFNYDTADSGSIEVGMSAPITYTGLEPISSTITPANVTLNYSGASETITVTEAAGTTTVNSDVGEITSFANPTVNLTINSGGGTDTINVDGLNFATSGLTITDPDVGPDDTVNFNTAPTTAGGPVDIDVQNTNINQPLNLGSLDIGVFNVPVPGGTTLLGADVTTLNQQIYNEVNTLGTDVTLTGNVIIFRNTLDGAFNLVLNDSAPAANSGASADIGGIDPLMSITTDAVGGTLFAGNVTTTGDQTYGGAEFLIGNNAAQTLSAANISFAGTLDESTFSTNTSLTTITTGMTTFGGDVGGIKPFLSLNSTMAGPFTASVNFTTNGDLTFNIPDTSADTDDLTINNAAVLTSTGGNILFNVGDDVDIQAGTATNAPGGTLTVNVDPIAGDADVGTGSTAIIAGAITTPNTFVNGGDDEDVFTPKPQAGTIFNIDGNLPASPALPGDVLNLDAMGGAITITPAGVTIGGSTVNFQEIESLNLTNPGTVTVTGDANDNVLTVSGIAGAADSATLVLDAGPIVTLMSPTPISLDFDALGGDDALVINETAGGLPIFTGVAAGAHTNTAYTTSGLLNRAGDQNVGIHFAAGASGAANNDRLILNFLTAQNLATFDDDVAAGNSGVVNIEGALSISYDSLTPIIAVGAGGTYTADASALPAGANLTVADDLADIAGPGGNMISGTVGFETRFVSGFDNLVVRSGLGANTITLAGLDPASTETAITLDADDIGNADASPDAIQVQSLPATVVATLFGGAGGDTFTIGDGFMAITPVMGQVVVSPVGDEAGAGDTLSIINFNEPAGTTATVNAGTLEGVTGFAGAPDVIYNGAGDLIETVNLTMSDNAADTFNVQSTQFGSTYFLDGGFFGAFDDVVNVASDAPVNAGNLNGIQGQLNIGLGSGGNTAINVSDAGDVAGDTYDLIFNPGTGVTELYFNDGGAAVGTVGVLGGGTAFPDIIFNTVAGNPLANFNLTGDTAANTYNVFNTTATVSNTITDGAGNSTFNIQGNQIAAGAANTFGGAAGTDTFNVNFAADTATPSAAGTTFQIDGGAAATSSARDVVFIQAAGTFTPGAPGAVPPTVFAADAAPRDIGLTYADATKASGDLNVTDALSATTVALTQVETVTYFGDANNNDIVTVTGTTVDDDLTVAPYSNNQALVFLDGDAWDGPSEGSQFDQFPGVAGGSAGPDIDIWGVRPSGVNVAGGGAGAAGDQLYVYAPSEDDLVDPATTTDPFGFGVGVIMPGSTNNPGLFPTAYDLIEVANNTSIVTITNDRLVPGAVPPSTMNTLLPVVPNVGSFAQASPLTPGLLVNAGFETNPAFDNIGDDILAFLSSALPIRINGGDPVPALAPNGDRLQVFTFNEINVYSDKSTPPIVSVTSTIGGTPTQPLSFSSIESTILTAGPGSQQANLIGDNNNPGIDQNDQFIVIGEDVDSMLGTLAAAYPGSIIDTRFEPDPDGDNEFTLQINGSAKIGFRNITDLNVLGDDAARTPSSGVAPISDTGDIDTLNITPYADDTTQGWAIDVSFDEGDPAGADGGAADLLIYNTAGGGGMVSENISVRPAGMDAGELVVTNLSDGSLIVDIDFTFNTDIIINDNDGFLNDTDRLTLLGTDPSNPGTSGNETVVADFTMAGGVGTPQFSVLDGATILYNIRNFTGFDTVDVQTLGGNDSLVFTPDTINANGLQNVALRYDGGDLTGDSLTVKALNGLRVTPGSENTSGIVDQLGAGVGNVTYINTGLINATSATAASALTVRGTNGEDAIAIAPTATANEARVWVNDGTVITGNAGGANNNLGTVNLQGRFGDDSFSVTAINDVAINVAGGGATDADTVIIHGTTGGETFNVSPTSASDATVQVNALGLITLSTVEALDIDGASGVDNLIYTSPAGLDLLTFTPAGNGSSGLVTGVDGLGAGVYMPVSFDNLFHGVTNLAFADAGAARADILTVLGTDGVDNFSVTAAGVVNAIDNSGSLTIPTIATAGVTVLMLDGRDGDDSFTVAGNHPLGGIAIEGGNPDDGSDVLNFTGAGATITSDLAGRTVQEMGFAAVGFTGIETVNIAGGAAALNANLTVADDELTYRPTGAASGTFQNDNDNTTFNFTNVAGAFTVNALASVGDHVIVEGTNSHDNIAVNSPNRTATVTDAAATVLKTVALAGDVEILTAMGRAGNDTFLVTPAPTVGGVVNGNLIVNVDGGGPGASDALVIATAAGATLPATDFAVNAVGLNPGEGRVRVFRNAVAMPDISYTNVEIVSPNVVVAGGVPQLLVMGPDASEPNEFRTNATHLGAGDSINVDNLAIFPNFGEHPGVPADTDLFQIVAESTGTLDVTAHFEMYAVGLLPGGGDLTLNVLDTLGNVIAGAGTFGNADGTPNARVRFPAVQGQTYFVRVTGTANNVVNAYELTITNEAPPIPFDLEINDIIQVGTVNAAVVPTTTVFRANIAPANAVLPPTTFDYVGKTVEFTSGANIGRSAVVTAFNSGTGQFTVGTGLIAAPAVTDTFVIESTDTGRSQFDNVTRDTTPIITFRLDDDILRRDVPGTPGASAPTDENIPIPFNTTQTLVPGAVGGVTAGYRVPVFLEGAPQQPGTAPQTPIGFARRLTGTPGVYIFDFAIDGVQAVAGTPVAVPLTNGSHFISAKVQIIDPSIAAVAPVIANDIGYGDRSVSMELVVDAIAPAVFFGDPALALDGLMPDSDSGDPALPATLSDRATNDTTPTFFGQAEANSIIRLFVDRTNDGFTVDDFLIGQTVASPLDGTNQHPFEQWELTSTLNMNDPTLTATLGLDGVRNLFVTAEDPAGNTSAAGLATLQIFIDTLGPQVTDVYPNADPTFDLFNVKQETPAPTPRIDSLTIRVQDLPPRVAGFLYPAISNLPLVPNGLPQGLITLIGDHSGVIPFASVVFTPDAFPVVIPAGGTTATGTITLTFNEPLPDDRFTLTLSDSIIDPVGNALDGESDGSEPGTPAFRTTGVSSGDGISGGDFVARFTVDSRPEVGTWSQGLTYVDINGNGVWDPEGQDNDATNRDFVYQFGRISDGLFAGNFASRGNNASGFDKMGAYGLFNGSYSFLLDTDDDGVGDVAQAAGVPQVNAAAVAGNFNGNALDGDEVALFDGANWYVFDIVGTGMVLTNTINATYNGIPFAGDFNGDGNDDFAVFVNDTNTVIFDTNRDGTSNGQLHLGDSTGRFAGLSGFTDKPVAGDLNLDGVDDIGIWVKGRQGVLPKEQGEFFFWVSDVAQNAGGAFVPDANPINNFAATVNFPAGVVGTGTATFSPAPLGNDLFTQWGDEFALPIFGNFDPPSGEDVDADSGTLTNTVNAYDVNNDGSVTSLDALVIINQLNAGVTEAEAGSRARLRATFGDLFVDVNGDTKLTAVDALQVINELNRLDKVGASGEATAAPAAAESGEVSWQAAVDSFFENDDDDDEVVDPVDDLLGLTF
ncbi:dockerin type I domain-containing protein [Aporhodopirellula aestuarii]|uniref:Dockerin type I domain-containing protein n=1 Tax=Aporhodopirellula aestuarii TaxID=2950107 RepID=A0ABT0U4U9_9BACT|nr:dockerin type I domain-containing protein [Aporhodopirellula aestuarii]MCM2371709.1 dockerin type I domain-containing protein [Aporhodopirellula aestuarii]